MQLIFGDVFKLLDAFSPTDAEASDWTSDVTYFSGLKIISNTWRGTGIQRKLWSAAAALFGEVLADKLFKKQMSQCVRTRWGSPSVVEARIDECAPFIANVFGKVFGQDPEKKKRRRVDDDDGYNLGKWRGIALRMSGSRVFLLVVKVSKVAKKELDHVLYW